MTENPSTSRGSIPANLSTDELGIIVIDHGSRREESNRQLLDYVDLLKERAGYRIVEPAHMEIATPDMAMAMNNCVRQGARYIVIHPWFLGPGRHWREHIPQLAAEAARPHPRLAYVITEPLGLHPGLVEATCDRITDALGHVTVHSGEKHAPAGK